MRATLIEGFSEGEIACLRCGRPVRLYFNGGELDGRDCCGLRYSTEYHRIDLVVEDISYRITEAGRAMLKEGK